MGLVRHLTGSRELSAFGHFTVSVGYFDTSVPGTGCMSVGIIRSMVRWLTRFKVDGMAQWALSRGVLMYSTSVPTKVAAEDLRG